MQRVVLGRTGIEVSRLAIGTGTAGHNRQTDQSRLGVEGCSRLLLSAYNNGITFWDTADDYGTHPHVAHALRQVQRDKVVLTTKSFSRSKEELELAVPRLLKELETDYIDILLLHCLTSADWPIKMTSSLAALSHMRDQGMIRALGVSCHSLAALEAAAGHPLIDVVLARINYAGVHMDAQPDQVLPVLNRMHAADQGVYGMKVYGQGKLVSDKRRALQYVLGLPAVQAVVIGMTTEAEVQENVALLSDLSS